MVRFRAARESVKTMRAAVASLASAVAVVGGERVALAEWVARQRVSRGVPPLVSSSAPQTALVAWRELQRRRFDRRG